MSTLDQDLGELRQKILYMGGQTEEGLRLFVSAIEAHNPHSLEGIGALECRVDVCRTDIDQQALTLLARRAPVAQDLRSVMAIVKINANIERIGDQIENISHYASEYLQKMDSGEDTKLLYLAEKVQLMVKQALNAFVAVSAQEAKQVIEMDDQVDELRNQMIADLKQKMSLSPEAVDGSLDVLMMAKCLERIGDHATNIAREVIFVATPN